MNNYKFVNTGIKAKLSSIIMSGDVRDENLIQIFDTMGNFITKGNWFQDNILSWGDFYGVARKGGTGRTISFNLVRGMQL